MDIKIVKPVAKTNLLMDSIAEGDIDEVMRLLDGGMSVNALTFGGRAALHVAVELHQSEIVKLLLSRGANPNGTDIEASTPLHLAINLRNAETIILLVEAGASTTVPNDEGDSPGHRWIGHCAFKSNTRPVSPFFDFDILESMVNHGLSVEQRNNGGSTLLMHAVTHGVADDILSGLIRLGSDLAAANSQGNESVHIAAMSKREQAMGLLVKHGANINAPNTKGETPLHLCGAGTDVENILSLGGNVHAKTHYGETPLLFHIKTGYQRPVLLKVIQMFLDAGSDPDCSNLFGETPRSILVNNKSDAALALLAAHDARKAMMKVAKVNLKIT